MFDDIVNFDFPSQMRVNLEADKDGMLGRTCFEDDCKKYFKVNLANLSNHAGNIYCPYCGAYEDSQAFSTQEQIEYAKSVAFRQILGQFGNELKKMEITPDPRALISFGISVKLPDLPSINEYTENEIKKVINCSKCDNTFALYGISCFCPFCGARDNFDVFLENIEQLKKKMKLDELISEAKDLLQNEGLLYDFVENTLKDSIGVFEAYCKNSYLKYKIIKQPQLDENKLLLDIGNSFQNIEKTKFIFKSEFAIEIESFIKSEDLKKVVKAFAKRHVLTHNSGIIDLKYIRQTGDDVKLLNRRVTVNSQEVNQLIELVVIIITQLNKELKSNPSKLIKA